MLGLCWASVVDDGIYWFFDSFEYISFELFETGEKSEFSSRFYLTIRLFA